MNAAADIRAAASLLLRAARTIDDGKAGHAADLEAQADGLLTLAVRITPANPTPSGSNGSGPHPYDGLPADLRDMVRDPVEPEGWYNVETIERDGGGLPGPAAPPTRIHFCSPTDSLRTGCGLGFTRHELMSVDSTTAHAGFTYCGPCLDRSRA